jgi:hypothetical protein
LLDIENPKIVDYYQILAIIPYLHHHNMVNEYRYAETVSVIFPELGIRYFFLFSLFAFPLLQRLFSLSLLRYFSEN